MNTQLVPLAEEVTKLQAVCTGCGADAAFSKRLTDDTDVELIGGSDIYTSMCRKCFTESTNTLPIRMKKITA